MEGNFAAKLDSIGQAAGLSAPVTETLKGYLGVPAEVQDACRLAISRKYGPGMERLLTDGVPVAI